jgi:hypothetical protein
MLSRSSILTADIGESRGRRVGTLGARVVLVGVMAASLLVTGVASANAGTPIPPGSKDAEKRGGYPALTAKWWTWATGIFPETPILDTTGELCGQGQKGKIWFLAGSFGGTIGEGTVERNCTVPANKTLFFPVFNTLWWAPEDGETAAEVRILSNESIVPVIGCELREPFSVCNPNVAGLDMEVLVDDEPVEDIFGYRAQSPPGGSLYQIEEGSWGVDFGGQAPPNFFPPGDRDPAVADGYWVMLRPLSPGDHTVVIRATVPGDNFELLVTYMLEVKGD